MLSSARAVDELVEALEVRFLANRDAHLHFGLLTDFSDADEETLPRTSRCFVWRRPVSMSSIEIRPWREPAGNRQWKRRRRRSCHRKWQPVLSVSQASTLEC
jgi:hypothetical protein